MVEGSVPERKLPPPSRIIKHLYPNQELKLTPWLHIKSEKDECPLPGKEDNICIYFLLNLKTHPGRMKKKSKKTLLEFTDATDGMTKDQITKIIGFMNKYCNAPNDVPKTFYEYSRARDHLLRTLKLEEFTHVLKKVIYS